MEAFQVIFSMLYNKLRGLAYDLGQATDLLPKTQASVKKTLVNIRIEMYQLSHIVENDEQREKRLAKKK